MKNPKLIHRLLTKMADSTLDGTCGLDDEEIEHIAESLKETDCGLEDRRIISALVELRNISANKIAMIAEAIIDRKMYEESICLKYGISRPTMYRWMKKGKLPCRFRKDGQGKKFLFESECDEAIERWIGENE